MPILESIGSSSARGMGMFGKISYYAQAAPNTIPNLAAWYTADSWTGSSWTDLSGNNRTATSYTGSIAKNTTYSAENGATKTFTTLSSADATGGIRLPSDLDVNADNYTLFHVIRRVGPTTGADAEQRGRIVDGLGDNWLSGFWYGRSGLAFHMNWLTQSDTDTHVNNWVISTDQLNLYRSNGITRTTIGQSAGSISASTTITINYGNYTAGGGSGSERGRWAAAEVIFFNRKLSSTEYALVEGYLANKYGIELTQ